MRPFIVISYNRYFVVVDTASVFKMASLDEWLLHLYIINKRYFILKANSRNSIMHVVRNEIIIN